MGNIYLLNYSMSLEGCWFVCCIFSQRLQSLICLHLFTDCFMISPISVEQIQNRIFMNLNERVCK